MNINDRSKAITAEDIIRRYNLDNLKTDRKLITTISNAINKQNNIIKDFVREVTIYKNQADILTVWFFDGIPSETHTDSIAYDRTTGKAYSCNGTEWIEIEDNELATCLALANSELDTTDGKRKIYYIEPTTPYQIGDIWLNNDTIYRAQLTRESGTFKASDFVLQSEYNEQNVLKDVKAVLDKFIVNVETNYVTTTALNTESDRIVGYVDAETIRTKEYSDGQVETAKTEVLSELSIEVGKINSKISNIGGITVQGTTEFATLDLNGVNDSKPISVLIYPTTENISYTYPRSNLYPSNTAYLKNRKLDFYNRTTEEHFYWELPTNLWYYNSETYDTMLMELGDGTNPSVTVTRKCGINADGTVYVLSTPTSERYEYPEDFDITSGDYTITLLGYSNAYLDVTLMASNLYTTQFPTFSEMRSEISQEAGRIRTEVSAKADRTELNSAIEQTSEQINTKVSKNNVISEINQTSESVTIDANKISLNGKTINLTSDNININSTKFKVDKNGNLECSNAKVSGEINSNTGTIGGWQINSSGLTNGVVKLNSDGSSTIYTVADLIIIRGYIMGTTGFDLPTQMINHYDLNGDGRVTAQDYVMLQNLIGITMN